MGQTAVVVPLHVLLSHALLDLTRAAERAGADEVVLWSNLLRVIDDEGVDRKLLPSLVRLSRRVVKSTVDGLERHGWAAIDGGVVRLTEIGRRARDEWGAAILQADSSWPGAETLRAPLEEVVSGRPLEHPHYPCGYGTADWRITGGGGVDWKPVPRADHVDTVSSLPVLALLSQTLVAFACDYESQVPFALHVGMHLHRSFSDDTLPLESAPPCLGITGDGRSSLERHGAVTSTEGVLSLTELGRHVRDAYRPTVASIEAAWSTHELRVALESLDIHNAGHADHPDVAHVGRGIGFAEVSSRSKS